MNINVLIADDHKILREGLASILNNVQGIHVIGQASDGEEAIRMAEELKPHVILMDLEMPYVNGIVATRVVKERIPSIKVLILSAFSEDERILEAMKAGASGYVVKRVGPEDLVAIIKACYQGEILVSPYLANLVLSEHFGSQAGEGSGGGEFSIVLSRQDHTILSLIVEGLSNEKIAELIHVSRDTVKIHIKHIFEKLQVHNRTQAAVVALEKGLIHR